MANEKDNLKSGAQGKMSEVARIIAEVVASLSKRFITHADATRIAEGVVPSELLNMDKVTGTGGDILTRGKSGVGSSGGPTAFWGKAVTALNGVAGAASITADTGVVITPDTTAKTVKVGLTYPPTTTAKAITDISISGGGLYHSYFPTVVANNGAQVNNAFISNIVTSVIVGSSSLVGGVGIKSAGTGLTVGISGNNVIFTNTASPFPSNGLTRTVDIITSASWNGTSLIYTGQRLTFVAGLLTGVTNLSNITITAEACN
jgi:hypothetical protein